MKIRSLVIATTAVVFTATIVHDRLGVAPVRPGDKGPRRSAKRVATDTFDRLSWLLFPRWSDRRFDANHRRFEARLISHLSYCSDCSATAAALVRRRNPPDQGDSS